METHRRRKGARREPCRAKKNKIKENKESKEIRKTHTQEKIKKEKKEEERKLPLAHQSPEIKKKNGTQPERRQRKRVKINVMMNRKQTNR